MWVIYLKENISLSGGGEQSSKSLEDKYSFEGRDLRVENSANSVSLKKEQEIKNPTLKTTDSALNLSNVAAIGKSDNIGQTSDFIRKEVKKEGNVIKVDKTREEKYKPVGIKAQSLSNSYQTAEAKIHRHKSTTSNRTKRSTRGFKAGNRLIWNERKNVWEMYKLYEQLVYEKDGLSNNLRTASEDNTISASTNWKRRKEQIETILNTIGWNGSNLNIIHEKSSWNKKWEMNPYKEFFKDKKDYEKFKDQINKAQAEERSALRGSLAFKDSWTLEAQNKLNSARTAFEMKVATKILKWMNRA